MEPKRFIIWLKPHLWKILKGIFITFFFILCSLAQTIGQPTEIIDCQEITPERFQKLDDNQRIRCGGEVLTLGDLRRQVSEATDRVTEFFKKTEKASEKRLSELKKKYSPPQKKENLDKLMLTVKTETRRNGGRMDEKIGIDPSRPVFIKPQIILVGSPFGVSKERDDPAKVEPSDEIFIGVLNAGNSGKVWIGDEDGKSEIMVEKWVDDEWKIIKARIPLVSNLPTAYGGPGFSFDLWVERADGAESNRWPMRWITEVKRVPAHLISVQRCGNQEANVNICNGGHNDGARCVVSPSKPPITGWGGDIVGQHFNCWGAIGNDEGSDAYTVTTPPNFFLVDTVDFHTFHTNSDEASASLRPDIKIFPGSTQWEPIVDWWVTPNDWAAYKIIVYMRGAKGF